MDCPIGAGDLKLDSTLKSSFSRRLEVPDEECGGECRSVAGLDEAQVGTRSRFEAQCRVQIPVRG
jgi:hypothetical protein